MKRAVMAAVISGLISAAAMAGMGFLESAYRSDTVDTSRSTTTNDFTLSYTNTTGGRVAIGSVMAMSTISTGNWSLAVVNNGQTHVLVAPTALTLVTKGIKYEGYGTVPLGKDGVLTLTGVCGSNAATATVKWQVHMLDAQ